MTTDVLSNLTLCTFSTGDSLIREILIDWFKFIGKKPRKVIVSVSPDYNYPDVYNELVEEGVIDELIPIGGLGKTVYELEPDGIYKCISRVKTKWVLLIKLDTLPYRKGYETWLPDAIKKVERNNLFGITGSSNKYHSAIPMEEGYSKVQKFSNNFSIFKPEEWVYIQDRLIGINYDGPLMESKKFNADGVRFAREAAVEAFLEEQGLYMLVSWENINWSVFHVNVWGDRLRMTRDNYLARKDVKRFMYTGGATPLSLQNPWQHYYGYPRPVFIKRYKIYLFQFLKRAKRKVKNLI